ncbi:MAG: HlyD family secretion protein [Pseudomonadota bacterium]
MSDSEDKEVPAATSSGASAPAKESAADDTATTPGAVKRGGLVIAGLIVVSLLWYLVSDRYTPYTTQARIQGYVVGVAPQVAGNLAEVLVQNNQEVAEGEVLFRIDPSNYEIALQKARSDYENAVRQVQAGDAGVEAARANLSAALANLEKAQKDTDRLERLRNEDPGTISERRLEISRASLDAAKASVSAAEASIEQAIEAKGGDGDSNTILAVAATGVEKAELDLERTVVRAESRGVITDLRADTGQFAGTGQPVMTLVAMHDVWINAEFTENNLGRMTPGTPVEILLDVLPGRVFEGEIKSLGLGISATQAPPPGTLPSVSNNRDWLRQAQRFPVIVSIDPATLDDSDVLRHLRIGGQASVIAYNDGAWISAWLGKIYVRFMSYMAYAY